MTIITEGRNSFFLTSNASILDDQNRDTAWAEKHISYNPNYKWILAKYAEADKANSNRQFWTLKDLQFGQPSITHSPMNLLHQSKRVVGTFVGTDMMFPVDSADETMTNPYIEALGVFWKYYFEDEYRIIERAHNEGDLFVSMECLGETVTCAGTDGCGKEFPYAGPRSPTYCGHINDGASIKQINKPTFLAGGLLIPPVKPGWKQAKVTDISKLVSEYADECEKAYEGIREEMPQGNEIVWEAMMAELINVAFPMGADTYKGEGSWPVRVPTQTPADDPGPPSLPSPSELQNG